MKRELDESRLDESIGTPVLDIYIYPIYQYTTKVVFLLWRLRSKVVSIIIVLIRPLDCLYKEFWLGGRGRGNKHGIPQGKEGLSYVKYGVYSFY